MNIVKALLGIGVLLVLLALVRTWQMERSDTQKIFSRGTIPNPPLVGFYAGSVPGYSGSWRGKMFDAKQPYGVNVFTDSTSTQREVYPFKTSQGKGLRDTNLDVFKIDYDLPENSFWLRPILDEVVQTGPNQYLGKLQLRIIPGYPFTLAFFHLKK